MATVPSTTNNNQPKALCAAAAPVSAVAEAVATATVEAFAAAASNCNEAVAAAKAADTKTAIAKAIADTSASACSTGGTATATSEVLAEAVATATASSYVEVLAAVSGPCGGCGKKQTDTHSDQPASPSMPAQADNTPKSSTQDAEQDHGVDTSGDKKSKDGSDKLDDAPPQKGEALIIRDEPDSDTVSEDEPSAVSDKAAKYKECFTWLRNDCCSGWRGRRKCHCFGFRGLSDVCQYKLVSGNDDDDAPLVWQDRWSHEKCQCSL